MNIKEKSGQGRIRLQIFAALPESYINAAAASGIEIWRLKRIDSNTLCFDAFESSLEMLEQLAKACSAEIEVFRYRAVRRRILKSRWLLLLLCLGMGTLLLISSLFIWKVEVHGNSHLSKGEILRVLEDSGIYVGRFWPGIKADDVRGEFMPKLPDVGWMTVNISGSRAVVLINERQQKPEIYDEAAAADLIASKTGLLRRVSVLNGKAAVEPGQAVVVGEKLADGRLESIMGSERLVRARGSVMADTWYEIDSVCPEEMELKSQRGISRHRFALVLGKRRINFYISSGKAIDECDKIINDYTLGVEGHFALPLRLVHEVIIPYESTAGKGYDTEEMGRSLLATLDSSVEGQILQSSLTESFARGLYVLTLRAHCIENIAQTQELTG
ncbi:MAG: sporulation protein YqfD [Oscillospiraceae bacterium]|nr:sporulation protein YqfD [Oscillospiraceae bacterium]